MSLSVALALHLRNMSPFLEEGSFSLFTQILKNILDSAKVKEPSVNDTHPPHPPNKTITQVWDRLLAGWVFQEVGVGRGTQTG